MNARLLILNILLLTIPALAQSPAKLKSDEEQMRDLMVTMSRQLGVTCTTCHHTDNFKSDKKVEFRIAKEHMKITQLLIDSGMDGKKGPKASCYMCHRGVLKPASQEPQSALKK